MLRDLPYHTLEQARILKFRTAYKLTYSLPLFLFSLPILAHAANVTLGWDPNTENDLDHYVLYWGTSSGNYTNNANISKDESTYRVTGLAANTKYYFVVTAVDYHANESNVSREVSWTKHVNPVDGERDLEWGITTGELKGFKIVFNSMDPVPTLADSSEIPPLNVSGFNAVGLPLNIETEPKGVPFTTPVKIFIPCPGFSDVSSLDVYYYEDGSGWVFASDADDSNTVQPEAVNGMVAGSRVNHNDGDLSTTEIQVYHFSGVQAGSSVSALGSGSSSGSGGGGCFIATAAFGSNMEYNVHPLIILSGLTVLTFALTFVFVRRHQIHLIKH